MRGSSDEYGSWKTIAMRRASAGGRHFHPRCPYVREAHTRVDPALEPIAGAPGHLVRCLLAHEVRQSLWHALQAGELPEEARAAIEEPAT